MTFIRLTVAAFVLASLATGPHAVAQAKKRPTGPQLHPDSKPQPGVPQGKVDGPHKFYSKVFPGTEREYAVYVPAQYDGKKPACVLVVQDGPGRAKGWKLPTVMDNLIHKKQMPVTIGVFIGHGIVQPAKHVAGKAQPRFNRSYEYDGRGDDYARFLLEEMLPEVSKKYKLSDDPNDRAIAGNSSGAIAAFTVAWERPDAFRRVISGVGTFVALRGGNEYPSLIRKFEPKPIRVFLEDGRNDLDIYPGSWWVANQDMLAALNYAGYDVNHAWSDGGHNAKESTRLMPDILRWLWRDYPKPITRAPNREKTGKKRRVDILIPDEHWQLVSEGHKFTEGPAVNAKGEVFFSDIPSSTIHRVGLDGKVTLFAKDTKNVNGLMFGPDGKLYACQQKTKRIVRYDIDGKEEVVVEDAPCNDIAILPDGSFYFTSPGTKRVYHYNPKWAGGQSKKARPQAKIVDWGIGSPNGVIPTADNAFLWVADFKGRFVYSFQIQPDGKLAHRQRYGHLHLPDDPPMSKADGMTVDTKGHLYVATEVGVQVLDQLGRVNVILEKPHRAPLANVVFGGKDRDWLFATCGDKVFKRKLNAKGVTPWQGGVKPPKPGL